MHLSLPILFLKKTHSNKNLPFSPWQSKIKHSKLVLECNKCHQFFHFFSTFMVIKYQRSALHTDIHLHQLCKDSKICTVNPEFFFGLSFTRRSQYFINMWVLAANIKENLSAQTCLMNDTALWQSSAPCNTITYLGESQALLKLHYLANNTSHCKIRCTLNI